MPLSRRAILAAPGLLLARSASAAPGFPTRPIRVIAPTAAGSGSDSFFRLVADPMAELLGQPVVVENRGGAGGVIGTEAVARAAPDGYTLGSLVGSHVMNRYVLGSLPYDAVEDFTPIIRLSRTTHILVASPKSPFSTAAELARLAREKPGTVTIAGSEPLSLYGGHLFARITGSEIISVPYRGSAAMSSDVIAGNVMASFMTSVSAMPHIEGGRLRALGVTSRERSRLMPNIPSLHEAGIDGFVYGGWFSLMGPANIPEPVVTRIADAARTAVLSPSLRPRLEGLGAEIDILDSKDFAALIKSDDATWAAAARDGLLRAQGS
jgi:tripartite-type tricarboxylate transporter receptor subunit TctC